MRSDSARIGVPLGGRSRADLQPLVRTIAQWADLRPVLGEVILFGDRVRSTAGRAAPVEIAVRYDPLRLDEGFDDWIEQLRTGFQDLHAVLCQPVEVALPNHSDAWPLIARGTALEDLARGKVRCVATPPREAVAPGSAHATPGLDFVATTRALWHRLAGRVALQPGNVSPLGRRPAH